MSGPATLSGEELRRVLAPLDSMIERTEGLETVSSMLDALCGDTPDGRAARAMQRRADKLRDKGDHETAERLEARADELLAAL